MVKPLTGKRAIVTGAASGIGHACAVALRDAGTSTSRSFEPDEPEGGPVP